MFNGKLETELSRQLIVTTNLRRDVDNLKIDGRDAEARDRHRIEYVTVELKRLEDMISNFTRDIDIGHVDAHNVKVKTDQTEVVQAIADLLNLGSLPASDSQIVVVHGAEE